MPIFMIYAPELIPNLNDFISIWNNLAKKNGLKGIYFIGQSKNYKNSKTIMSLGINGICLNSIEEAIFSIKNKYINSFLWHLRKRINLKVIPLNKFNYSELVKNMLNSNVYSKNNIFPVVVPNFDHSPRSGREGLIINKSTPKLFKKLLNKAIKLMQDKEYENKIIFLRSWNEWAEGNYVEPDICFGNDYLEVLKDELVEKK